jgi:hypothetical protein
MERRHSTGYWKSNDNGKPTVDAKELQRSTGERRVDNYMSQARAEVKGRREKALSSGTPTTIDNRLPHQQAEYSEDEIYGKKSILDQVGEALISAASSLGSNKPLNFKRKIPGVLGKK